MTETAVSFSKLVPIEDLAWAAGKWVVLDTETTGLHWWSDKLIGVGFYAIDSKTGEERQGYINVADYIPVEIGEKRKKWVVKAVPNDRRIYDVKQAVADVVRTPGTVLFGHNLKFDAHFLGIHLWELPIPFVDTTIMVHLYDSRIPKNLSAAESRFLSRNSKREHVDNATLGLPKRLAKDFTLWPLEAVSHYCVNDCAVTFQLAQALRPKLVEMKLVGLFNKQLKYLGYLQRIECRGMRLDLKFCQEAILQLRQNEEVYERELQEACGKEFNWRSYRQMSEAIWEGIGLRKPRNPFVLADGSPNKNHPLAAKYNDWCTAQDVLAHEKHPLADLISHLRETTKLRATVEKWMELADSSNNIHGSFNLTGTRTGRLSSSNPNLQNVAGEKRKRISVHEEGEQYRTDEYQLRRAFVARPGYRMVGIDHSQQEIRMLAIQTQEPTLLQALVDRSDMHMAVCQKIWGSKPDFEEHKDYYRAMAKNIHFAILYGLSVGAMSFRTDLSYAECEAIMRSYYHTFPGILPWQNRIEKDIVERQFTRYWSNRIWREDDPAKAYVGVNAQIQGGSADLMMEAAMRCMDLLEERDWGAVVSIIHDEILFEIKEEFVDTAIPELLKTVEVADLFGYPFAADAAIGDSYGELYDIALFDDDEEFQADIDLMAVEVSEDSDVHS